MYARIHAYMHTCIHVSIYPHMTSGPCCMAGDGKQAWLCVWAGRCNSRGRGKAIAMGFGLAIGMVMCMSIGMAMIKVMGMAMMIIMVMRMLVMTTMAMVGLMQTI